MGITARGAWESVKRHFREMGVDIQTRTSPSSASATCRATCSATACCCRSTHPLLAAFDHRHIFLDPTRPARELRRARAPVRAAALELGGLRQGADLAGRRRLPAQREVDPAVAEARARSASKEAEKRDAAELMKAILRRRSTCSGTAASAPT
jgi:hypothetical protein